jgi:hypothetical protein
VFHPSAAGKKLREFLLRHGRDAAVFGEQQGA